MNSIFPFSNDLQEVNANEITNAEAQSSVSNKPFNTNNSMVKENDIIVSPSAKEDTQNTTTAQNEDGQSSVALSVSKPVCKTKKAKPDYELHYTDQESSKLIAIKEVVTEEIKRVIADVYYDAIPFGDKTNAVVNINATYKNKHRILAAKVNREHGSDEVKTGASVMKYGCQHPIIIITYKMAKAAGIEVKAFKNDPDQSLEFNDDDLVLIDGHGRINFLFSIAPENWPSIFGFFPSPDRSGFYDLRKLINEININVSKWGTPNLVQKRQNEEGEDAHPGWTAISDLVKKGYMYQAACLATTLGTDRIKASEINGGDANKIFANYTHATKIHDALVKKMDEAVLKTKHFPGEISTLWASLVAKGGNEFATDNMIKFIEGLTPATIAAINNAKKSKEGVGKDEIRKQLLNDAFKAFCSQNDIQL